MRKQIYVTGLILILVAFCCANGIAEKPTEEVVSLNLQEAMQRAIEHSDDIAILHAAIDVAKENKNILYDIQDPEIRVRYVEEQNDQEYQASARFFPPNPWVISQKASAADGEVNAVIEDSNNLEWMLSVRVMELAAEVDYLRKDLELISKLVKIFQTTLEATRKGTVHGQMTIQNIAPVSRLYLETIADRNKAARRYDEKNIQLSTLIGIPAKRFKINIDESNFKTDFPVSNPEIIFAKNVIFKRSDLAARRWRVLSAEKAYKAQKAAAIPWLQHIQLSYANNQEEATGQTDDSEEWRIEAAFNIPLFSWWNNSSKLRFKEYQMAKTIEASAISQCYVQFRNALDMMQSTKEAKRKFMEETGPVIENMQKILLEAERADFLPSESARIREQLLKTQRAKLLTEFDYLMSVINFEKTIGKRTTEFAR
ncbi:TolC family protein [Verrucomicrobiota bacterium]